MGKRKHKDSSEYIMAKIRKLEKRLQRRRRESSYSSNESDHGDWGRAPSIESDVEIQSVIENQNVESRAGSPNLQFTTSPKPSTSKHDECLPMMISGEQERNIPGDILEILGDSKKKQEVFGPNIQEEISKRWGRILCEGLKSEQKKEMKEKILIPENFQLVKAPKLNPEIAAVLNENSKNRDKRLESSQNYLGLGIAGLTSVISSLIDKDITKIDLLKHLSEVNQILLDLHFENTLTRRKLITSSVDKTFINMIRDVERDSFLFGENLTEKIRASKAAEKSGLQIKKSNHAEVSTSKKPTGLPGNWKAPPRQQGYRRGGAKTHPNYRSSKTSAASTDRRKETTRTRSGPRPRAR